MPGGIRGCDISHYQNVTSFHQLAASGIVWMYIKATDGLTIRDTCYPLYNQRAGQVGILRAPYHFYRQVDPEGEAKFFLETAQLQPGMLVPVLDSEIETPAIFESTFDCATAIKRICGHWPTLYTSDYLRRTYFKGNWPAGANIILAQYSDEAPDAAASAWQFSQSGVLPGIDGNVDLDVWLGTEAGLKAMVIPED